MEQREPQFKINKTKLCIQIYLSRKLINLSLRPDSPYQYLIAKKHSDSCKTTAQWSGSEVKNEQMEIENVQSKAADRNCTSNYCPKVLEKLETSYKPEVVVVRIWGVLKSYSMNASRLKREYDLPPVFP